jgi:Mg2+-importing ATPase
MPQPAEAEAHATPATLPRGNRARGLDTYWAVAADVLADTLDSDPGGLTSAAATLRLQDVGPNALRAGRDLSRVVIITRQLRSPLMLLLVFAACASAATGQWLDAGIVLTIVVATAAVGYSREYSAESAAAALRGRLLAQSLVVRDGHPLRLPTTDIVPGDVVMLAAGSLVPADGVLLEATDFFVSQSALTGESFPVQKQPGTVAASAGLVDRTNCVFLGTNVRSGTARCLVVATGGATEFGAIAHGLAKPPPEAEFDRGIRLFGYLLTSAMLVLVIVVFFAHIARGRPPAETLLFAVALAVGLSPELLPAILSVNLARGAQMMAHRGVLVRRLSAIENLGSIDLLCTDKTGTLTEGVVQLEGAYDSAGRASDRVLDLAVCNASLETGVSSPLDDALVAARVGQPTMWDKVGEVPFDFVRKRVTVVIRTANGARLVMKGAFHHVLEACAHDGDGQPLTPARQAQLEAHYDEWSGRGIRVLAVAERALSAQPRYSRDDERDMTFAGFLTFLDRPKPGVDDAIRVPLPASLLALIVVITVVYVAATEVQKRSFYRRRLA